MFTRGIVLTLLGVSVAVAQPARPVDSIPAIPADDDPHDCDHVGVSDPKAIFDTLKIRTSHLGKPEDESLRAYIETRVMDGTLTTAQRDRFFVVLSARTHGVMNPASRGASQIAFAVASTLRCFAVDTPSTGARGNAPARTSEPLLLAKKIATDMRVSLYSYHARFIGNTDGRFTPIVVLPDGGSLIVGTVSDIPPGGRYEIGKSHAIAIRLDPRGKIAWQRKLDKKGFLDYEGGSVAPTADGGCVVFVLSYVHPARGAVTRFVKLDKKGRVLWDRQLRGDGRVATPFPSQLVQMTAKGSIVLAGHIYLQTGGARTMNAWTGELDKNGRVIADKIGAQQGGPMFGGAGYGGAMYGGSMYGH